MENDNGKLNFGIGLDLNTLRNDAELSKQLLAEIGTEAVRQGDIIDRALGDAGAAQGFNVLEAAIRGTGTVIKDLDFQTAEEKIGALSYIIQQNESVLAENTAILNKWKEEAQEAFNSGDIGTLEAITKDIDDQVAKIQELSAETESYRNALNAVMSVQGMDSQVTNVPHLYNSEEDIEHVEELRQKIADLQAEISSVGQDGGDTTQLTVQLSEMKDELNGCEKEAAEFAASLGAELGNRAAEAQQSLRQLNKEVNDQEQVVSKLSETLAEAKEKYETLQETEGASSEEVERAAAVYDAMGESLTNAQERLIALKTAQQTAQAEWDNVSREVENHDSVMVKMFGGYDNYQKILSNLPQPIQSVISGLQGMTGAAKAFIATPLGAIIAAIVIALQAVHTWLNSTVEGQLKFAEISGYVSGVLDQLKEIVIAVGRAIFKAFTDPKKAVKELWTVIKENVVNRFKSVGEIASALGKILKAAFTLDTDGIQNGLKELTNGFLKFGTGIDNVTGKLTDYVKGVNAAASENAAIARANRELEIQESEWQKKNQELEQIKAKARGKMSNSSLSTAERRKAKKQYEDALNEQSAAEKKIADKKIELQKRSMELTSNTIEDENKLRELEAERLAIETKRQEQLASLERRDGMMNNSDASAARKIKQEAEKRKQALTALGEMQAQIMINNQNRDLALMKEGHGKKIKEIEIEYNKEQNAIKNAENKFAKLNKVAGKQTGEDGLTDEQRNIVQRAKELSEQVRQNDLESILSDSQQAMNDYLKEYGTFQEQKLAIAMEFAERIKEVENSSNTAEYKKWKIAELKKQQEKATDNVEASAVMSRIDWYQVFGNVGGIMKGALKPLLEDLKSYVKTDNFQKLGADQQKQIIDAMSNIRGQLGTNADLSWKNLAEDISAYQEALKEARNATSDYSDLQEDIMPKLKTAQEALKKAKESGNQGEIKKWNNEVSAYITQLAESGEKVTRANSKVQTSGQKLAQTAVAVTKPIDDIHNFLETTGLTQLKSLWDSIKQIEGGFNGLKSIREAADGAKEVKKATEKMSKDLSGAGEKASDALSSTLSKGGLIAQIIGAVLTILDILKDGVGTFLSNLIDTILNSVSAILKNALSGKFIEQIFGSLIHGIGSIIDIITGAIGSVLTFGMLSSGGISSWVTNSNAKEVAKTTERLTAQNEALQHSIDKLKDSIDKNYGGKAISDYQIALKAQKDKNANLQAILNSQQGYHSSHHSNAYYWNMSDDETALVNKLLGTALRGNVWDDWAKLTAEQMDKIRTYLPSVWSSMLGQGKYDKSEYFVALADEAGKIKELTDKIKENLLNTSFSSLRDKFIDQLMNMETDAEEFANNFEELMQRALLRSAISNKFDAQIKKWYDSVTKSMMKEDGSYKELNEEQLNYYREWWEKMTGAMIEERDRIAELTGYTSQSGREATQKGIATASQESVDELNGRATAIQGHTYNICEYTKQLVSTTNQILVSVLNIESATNGVGVKLEKIEGCVKDVKHTVENIAIKGIKIR